MKSNAKGTKRFGPKKWLTLFCQIWMMASFITMQCCQCQTIRVIGHDKNKNYDFSIPFSTTEVEENFHKMNRVKVKKEL